MRDYAGRDGGMTDNGNGNGSGLSWIRRRHEELSADRTLDKPIPGYGGRIVMRFGPVPWATITRVQALATRMDRDGANVLQANSDVLIAACREVLVDGESPDPSGEPVRVDVHLAELLGSETTTARETLRWLFPHEIAISAMAGEVLEWTQSASADIAENLVGE
jgi:hypothetical protein